MANVLIVDDSGSVELHTLLTENGWVVHTSGAKGAVAAARAATPDVVAVLSLGNASARFVAHLQQHLAAACPPVLVSLAEKSDPLRDQCLIAGAHDVTFDGNLDDIAAKLDVLTNGWLRGTPKRPFVGLVRAQRGKQNLTLQAADIDPSGLGLVSSGDLVAGELLRAALALPGGSLIIWGRVSEADGALGLRFVGLASEDRVRLAGAIKGSSDRGAPSRPAQAIVPPVMTPSAAAPVIPAPPVASVPSITPEPVSEAPETEVSEAPPEAPSETTTSPSGDGQSLIDGLIGSALSDGESADVSTSGEGEAGEALPPSPTALTPWPPEIFVREACLSVLRDALTLGLVGELEGAPLGSVVLDFTRSISLPEQRAYDLEPPASLPEQGLAIRCLELRLRLFAFAKAAHTDAATGAGTYAVDAGLLTDLDAEVNTASNELQSAINGFFATSDTARIKEMNQFRNSLLKAQADWKGAVAAIRGEVTEQSGRAVLLDVAEQTGEQKRTQQTLPPQKEAEKKPEAKVSEFIKKDRNPVETRRRRMIALLVILVIALGVAIWAIPTGGRRLGTEELAQIGALDIIVVEDTHKAAITVPDTWPVNRAQVDKVRDMMAKYNVHTFVVRTVKMIPVAYVVPNQEPTIIAPPRATAQK